MLRGDDDNFLKLAAALKIILGRSIQIAELPRAKMLLESYLGTFLKVSYKDFHPFLADDLCLSTASCRYLEAEFSLGRPYLRPNTRLWACV